jgi:hypothetical protein
MTLATHPRGEGCFMELGLLSNSLMKPGVNWTTLSSPLFAALSEKTGTRTIHPPPLDLRHLKDWKAIRAQVDACDTLFWMQSASRPEVPVHLASLLNLSARRSAFVVDAWKPLLWKIGLAATIQRLDPCFVPYREAIEELRRRFALAKFEWLPYSADTRVFYPRAGEKSIFAFWMGRRHEPLHQALIAYCEARDLPYVYSNDGRHSADDLGRLTSSAQYFVVTPPDVQRSGGFSPIVMRYFEGLAAGTRLLGVLPASGEYESLLPTDAICQVALDGSDLSERLDQDAKTDHRKELEAACALVHERHSWRRRAQQIYDHLAHGAAIKFPDMLETTRRSLPPITL